MILNTRNLVSAWCRQNPDGKGTAGCLFFIVLLGIAIVICVNAGPPYYAYKSFEADVKTEVSRAGARFHGDEIIRQNILDLARKNEIDLELENIKVRRLAAQLHVTVQYAVPIDYLFYRHTMKFDIRASSYVGTL